jgi:hypothetical protein
VADDNNAVLIVVDLHNIEGLTFDDIEVGPLLEIVEDAAEAEFEGAPSPLNYGDRSADIDALAEGAGAAIAWINGPRGYMIVSTMQPGDDPLVDYAGLQDLAGLMVERAR